MRGPFASYKRSVNAVLKGLLQFASPTVSVLELSRLPTQVVEAWKEDSASRSHAQQIYLADTIIKQIQAHDEELKELTSSSDRQFVFTKRVSDIIDSCLLAAAFNPSKDKLGLFAAIAVNGAVTYSTDPVEQSRELFV